MLAPRGAARPVHHRHHRAAERLRRGAVEDTDAYRRNRVRRHRRDCARALGMEASGDPETFDAAVAEKINPVDRR